VVKSLHIYYREEMVRYGLMTTLEVLLQFQVSKLESIKHIQNWTSATLFTLSGLSIYELI
jgi:hypothetical protein